MAKLANMGVIISVSFNASNVLEDLVTTIVLPGSVSLEEFRKKESLSITAFPLGNTTNILSSSAASLRPPALEI